MIKLSCPHCGFSKDVPSDRIPQGVANVTCPKCQQSFPLEAETPDPSLVEPAPAPTEPAPEAAPEQPANLAEKVTITCPHCSTAREVDRAKIPPRDVKVLCNRCNKDFTFQGSRFLDPTTLEQPEQHPVLESTPEEASPEQPKRTRMLPLGELFSTSWAAYKNRIFTLIGINLLAFVLTVVGYLLLGSGLDLFGGLVEGNSIGAALAGLLMVVFSFLVMSWIGAATTYAIVNEDLGVRQSLGYGLQRVWSFLWLFLLLGFIITGGYMIFFLPGILFTVWFIFAQFILARDDTRGMEALLKSKEYVRGHGWAVCGRIILIGLVMMAISTVLAFIPLVGPLISLLLWPYVLIYYHEIYRDLSEIKGFLAITCTRGEKAKWLVAGALGFILVPAAGLMMAGPALMQSFSLFNETIEIPTTFERGGGSLVLNRTQFAPGEKFTVYFTASADFPRNAWVGIIPTQVPHGDETVNDQYDLTYRYLEKQTSGKLQFSAPTKAGEYDLRMHDTTDNGVEITSITFRIVEGNSQATAPTPQVSPGDATATPDYDDVSLSIDSIGYDAGQEILVSFDVPQGFPSDAWVGIIPADVPHGEESVNDEYDLTYQYLDGQTSGTLSFYAPDEAGLYDVRMHDSDSNGIEVASVSFEVYPAEEGVYEDETDDFAEEEDVIENSPDSVTIEADGENSGDVMIYVYSLNYLGQVRLNGNLFYKIEGETDMNYNYTGSTTLNSGRNLFEIDYEAIPGDPWKTELQLKVFRFDTLTSDEIVFGQWTLNDASGQRRFEVVVE